MHNDTKCLFVSAFPIQKARFEEIKYKKLIWLGIKRNFLEKVAFWVLKKTCNVIKELKGAYWKKFVRVDLYILDSQGNYQITLQ